MHKVIIGFSKPINRLVPPVFSWAIRLIEWTKFSHCYIKFQTRAGHILIFEAAGGSLRLINYDYWKKQNKTIAEFHLELSEFQYRKFFSQITKTAGTPYGNWQILGIFLHNIFNFKSNLLSRGSQAQVCSENVMSFLKNIYGLPITYNQDLVTPKDIYKKLTQVSQEIGSKIIRR